MCEDKSEEQLEEERAAHTEHPGMGREQHKRLKSLPKNNTLSQVAVAVVRYIGFYLHIHFLMLFHILFLLLLRGHSALSCPALPCPALPCPALPCPALPCLALPYPTLPYPALPCLALLYPTLPYMAQ